MKFVSNWINFKIRHWKNFHCRLSKISLHYLTASPSEDNSLSPTVQLDFSWTLEISDRQHDRFARPSECLSSFLSATWKHATWKITPITLRKNQKVGQIRGFFTKVFSKCASEESNATILSIGFTFEFSELAVIDNTNDTSYSDLIFSFKYYFIKYILCTVQKLKFFIKDSSNKCDQICKKQQIRHIYWRNP